MLVEEPSGPFGKMRYRTLSFVGPVGQCDPSPRIPGSDCCWLSLSEALPVVLESLASSLLLISGSAFSRPIPPQVDYKTCKTRVRKISRGHPRYPCKSTDHIFCSEVLLFVGWLLTVLQTRNVWGYLDYKDMIYYFSFQVLFSRFFEKSVYIMGREVGGGFMFGNACKN